MMREKLGHLEDALLKLEQTHARQLAYFEETKAIKRQMEHGISGTAH